MITVGSSWIQYYWPWTLYRVHSISPS